MKTPINKEAEERIVALYLEKKESIKFWFEDVRNELERWMAYQHEKRIHSVRARMKDEHHLREKIRRKNLERKQQNDPAKPQIDEKNFFSEVIDLAGVRVLSLYRHDLAIIDHFIYQCDKWRVLSAEANVDEVRLTDIKWFRDLGFSENSKIRRLKLQPNGYASIHYVLVKPTLPECGNYAQHHEKCELQIRTIHEEAWGEFSHEYSYPDEWADPLAKKLIVRLSSLLHLAEDLVGDIRRFPADAKIFREIHELAGGGGKSKDPELAVKTITQLISQFPYMTRSAPLAAIGLLTNTVDHSVGTINADQIVTTGFGTPSFLLVKDQPLRRIYLEAQSFWAKKTKGNIAKYYFQDHNISELAPPDKSAFIPPMLDYFVIPRVVSEHFHCVLKRRGLTPESGYNLRDIQMFIWTSKSRAPSPVKLPGNDRPLFGFYSPTRDSDLLAGVVWCADKDEKMFRLLHAYGQLLVKLTSNEETCVSLPVKRKMIVPNSMTKNVRNFIEVTVDECFGKCEKPVRRELMKESAVIL